MRKLRSHTNVQRLRNKLIAVIRASDVDFDSEIVDTSLIRSGQLDSLGLFSVALFIEREVGREVDFAGYDIAREWDTVDDILAFIDKLRQGA